MSVAMASPTSEFLYTARFLFEELLQKACFASYGQNLVDPLSQAADVTE
jgi:hypothetical protein